MSIPTSGAPSSGADPAAAVSAGYPTRSTQGHQNTLGDLADTALELLKLKGKEAVGAGSTDQISNANSKNHIEAGQIGAAVNKEPSPANSEALDEAVLNPVHLNQLSSNLVSSQQVTKIVDAFSQGGFSSGQIALNNVLGELGFTQKEAEKMAGQLALKMMQMVFSTADDQARNEIQQAKVQFTTGMISAALGLGGSAISLGGAMKGSQMAGKAKAGEDTHMISQKMQLIQAKTSAYSGLLSGVLEPINQAQQNLQLGDLRAKATKLQAIATILNQMLSSLTDFQNQQHQNAQRTFDSQSEMTRSLTQASNSLAPR